MHGSYMDRPDSPDGVMFLADSEFVVRVFGKAYGLLDSVGFDTNFGRTFGPWGGIGGDAFSVPGVAVGFFGWDFNGGVSFFGVYTRLDQRQQYSKWRAGINWDNCERWDDGPGHASNTALHWFCKPFRSEERQILW
jgi:hypothetical protein